MTILIFEYRKCCFSDAFLFSLAVAFTRISENLTSDLDDASHMQHVEAFWDTKFYPAKKHRL